MHKSINIMLIVAITCLLAGCSSTAPSAQPSFTGPVNNDNLVLLMAEPDRHLGAPAEITGKIVGDVNAKENYIEVRILPLPRPGTGSVLVRYWPGSSPVPVLNTNDFIKVAGTFDSMVQAATPQDKVINLPLIKADRIEKLNAEDIMAPALKTIQVDKNQEQNGILVTVEKVEIAREETRIYLKVDNNRPETAYIDTYSSKLVQNGSDFTQSTNYMAHYPGLPGELDAGASASGIITCKALPVAASSASYVIEVYSSDYSVDFEPFSFDFQWQ